MMKNLLLLTTLSFAAAAHAQRPLTPAEASVGDWYTQIGAVVRIAPCMATQGPNDGDLCMHIVQLSPNPPQTTDVHNPDAALQKRALVCMQIGSGFHQSDAYHLGSGHLYDPISGHTYRGSITPGGDILKLRGYVLFTIFGRTETWHRAPVVAACK